MIVLRQLTPQLMDKSIPSIFLIRFSLAFLCFSSYSINSGNANRQLPQTTHLGNANNGPVVDDNDEHDDGFLVPNRPCRRPVISPEANRWGGGQSLIVMNRWCGLEKDSIPTLAQLLQWDAQRVRSIQARLAARSASQPDLTIDLPAYAGSIVYSANFVVEVGLGSPPQKQHLIFDTGSEATWVQCKTCILKKCFNQTDGRFDPHSSTTIKCGSDECKALRDVECRGGSDRCEFKVGYADGAVVYGDFLKDSLTLNNGNVINDYIFGCVTNYDEPEAGPPKLNGSSGIMGLGYDSESIIHQAAGKFGHSFSYCLPTGKENIGHLTFGQNDRLKSGSKIAVPILRKELHMKEEYLVALEGIIVGETRLNIPKSVFSATEGTLIDSGTAATYLPPEAYRMLEDEFRKQMGDYSRNLLSPSQRNPNHKFTTCYNLIDYPKPKKIAIPSISLVFSGGGTIRLNDMGVMGGRQRERCLFFLPNNDAKEASIIGSYAQQTFDVIYDLKDHLIRFGPGGCK